MKRLAWICCALAFSCATTSAKDIYVSAASSGGDGSKAKPYKYLWRAVDNAQRGDVIHVAAGVYEGKGGCGHFLMKTPNLTLAGGYTPDFSKRDPFTNRTLLQRAKDFRGSWTGLPEGVIACDSKSPPDNLIVDGFWMNGQTRNVYQPGGDINPRGSYHGRMIGMSGKDVAIRNCVLLNPYGTGMYCGWRGEKNEISNCFVINSFYAGISLRSNQPESAGVIKNCTILFTWFQPGKGGGRGILIGNEGIATLENNLVGFVQTEDQDDYGEGVVNGFGNDDTVMKNNRVVQCQGGYYKYLDEDKKYLLIWKSEDLNQLNDDAESFMLAEAEGNSDADPQIKPDKDYFERFSNTVASRPGKLKMDIMNEWRRSVGLPLQAEPGSPRKNWGMAYPIDAVIPNLVSPVKGLGVQPAGPFRQYASQATAAAKKQYAKMEFDGFFKSSAEVKNLANTPVTFVALIGPSKLNYALENAPRSDYECYVLAKPGSNPSATRDFVYGYFLKGSPAAIAWKKLSKKADRYNKKGGVVIQGTASYLGNMSYSYPVGVIVDSVSKK
ncbi:MAG: right-handed parallel beta-helix repeat-containing protein [Phycisphaerae bacterium]|nr:right-handed parallel beta-helix repeat-containing protein [Phycisphaerae bacterium]